MKKRISYGVFEIILFVAALVLTFVFFKIDCFASGTSTLFITEQTEMMSTPDINSDAVVTLEEGTLVIVVEKGAEWTEVKYRDYAGFIQNTVVSETYNGEELAAEFAQVQKEVEAIDSRLSEIQREKVRNIIYIVAIATFVFGAGVIVVVRFVMKKIEEKEGNEGNDRN